MPVPARASRRVPPVKPSVTKPSRWPLPRFRRTPMTWLSPMFRVPPTAHRVIARSQIFSDRGGSTLSLNPLSIALTGGGQPHDNMQPSLCVNYIIALEGIYPSRN